MIVRAAKLEDAFKFNYDGEELEVMKKFDWRNQLAIYLQVGVGYIYEDCEKDIMFAGHYVLSPGVLHFWMLFNKDAKNRAKDIIGEFRKLLAANLQSHNVHRIQTLVYKGNKKDAKFAEAFGFKKEGMLEAFGPGKEDVVMYKVIK